MKKLTIRTLVEHFDLEVISGKDHLDIEIGVYGLNRAGLELTGFFSPASDKKHKRAVMMSSKENLYMNQFDEQTKRLKYAEVIKSGAPVILITKKFVDETLISVAKDLDFPLLRTDYPSTSELTQKILDLYDEYFAPTEEVHASLINIFGKGILITGESGIGKSEISLELIKNNHLFVGDDRIILTNKGSRIYGKSHPILRNLVEVRGIGIIDVSKTNGYKNIMQETTLDMIIELFKFGADGVDASERLGRETTNKKVLGVDIPYLKIPVSSGRNIANIIESAVAQLKINQSDVAEDIISLMNKRILEINEEN
ncbi:HPr kinase/phosphorylase [Mesoplasma syrphidae]|uniref:HPr kinase/phosphorylase n=1 Tax=Mesoplasma syrphidae TaxID=225999 RepID=A0A2K9C6C1_9MOLU|nr:HPr(Ser) kinase/phosphatase [Mesoplasma syrphidae]AUF83837.1 HPr kinase/phosphorylase [Mesoplasma syrphidae]